MKDALEPNEKHVFPHFNSSGDNTLLGKKEGKRASLIPFSNNVEINMLNDEISRPDITESLLIPFDQHGKSVVRKDIPSLFNDLSVVAGKAGGNEIDTQVLSSTHRLKKKDDELFSKLKNTHHLDERSKASISSSSTPLVSNCAAEKEYNISSGLSLEKTAVNSLSPNFWLPKISGFMIGMKPPMFYRAPDPIRSIKLDDNVFNTEIFIPRTNIRSVFEIAAKVDLLSLWCEPIAVAYMLHEGKMMLVDEEYDGEWIKLATTLQPPRKSGSCIFICCNTVKNYLGFPNQTYASLFIERKRCQIVLTLGPIGGFREVVWRIKFETSRDGVIVINNVTLNADILLDKTRSEVGIFPNYNLDLIDDDKGSSKCAHWCPFLGSHGKGWYFPGLVDHMNQTAISMKNLKELVERSNTSYNLIEKTFEIGIATDERMIPLLGGTT